MIGPFQKASTFFHMICSFFEKRFPFSFNFFIADNDIQEPGIVNPEQLVTDEVKLDVTNLEQPIKGKFQESKRINNFGLLKHF